MIRLLTFGFLGVVILASRANGQSCLETGCAPGSTCLSCVDGEQLCASNAGDLSRGCAGSCGSSHYCYSGAQCTDPSSGTCSAIGQQCGNLTCTAGSTCLSCSDGEQICAASGADLSRGCAGTCGSTHYCYSGAQCTDPNSGTCAVASQQCGNKTCAAGSTCLSCTDGEQVCAGSGADLSRGCASSCGSKHYCYSGAQCTNPNSGTCLIPTTGPVPLKAMINLTSFQASGGKIIKSLINNKSTILSVSAPAGAQVVAMFDAKALRFTEMDIVDRCGNVVNNVGTVGLATDATCQDTGPGSKEELICPLEVSVAGWGQAFVLSDIKLTFDSFGNLKGGGATLSGVGLDGSGNPLQFAAVVSGVFKPAKGCP